MALKHLGDRYDIHTSGADLIFPHHENAIAIGQALAGKPPASYWVHNELLTFNDHGAGGAAHESMTLRDLLDAGYTGREIRYWLMSGHYRKAIRFAWSKLQTAKNTVARLDAFIQKIHFCRKAPDNPEIDQIIYDLRHRFSESLDEDMNMAPALAALFRAVHRMNVVMDRNGLSDLDKNKALEALKRINGVFGIMELSPPPRVDESVEDLIRARERARAEKDWKRSDELRQRLENMGIRVVDTREGPVWHRIEEKSPSSDPDA
jgi:cysteinyl-tRNA synthetase